MNQIREVIWERQKQTRESELIVREVELKTLAHFIAASAGFPDGVREAQNISLLARSEDKPKELNPIPTSMISGMFG